MEINVAYLCESTQRGARAAEFRKSPRKNVAFDNSPDSLDPFFFFFLLNARSARFTPPISRASRIMNLH